MMESLIKKLRIYLFVYSNNILMQKKCYIDKLNSKYYYMGEIYKYNDLIKN